MTEHEASRTLVKSPPELWAELSDESSLAGHLAEPFGEIRITRLDPETAVAWEGERASGTVRIEPSGWGTRVTLTARAVQAAPPGPADVQEPDPPAPAPPAPARLPPAAARRHGLLGRLRGWLGGKRAASPDPPPAPDGEIEPLPAVQARAEPQRAAEPAQAAAADPSIDPAGVLVGVLDRLGAAHRRPFSRS